MALVTKVAGVLLVGGGIVGAGTAYTLNSGTNESKPTITTKIKDKLNSEKKKLLESDTKELWDIKLSTYKAIIKKDNALKISAETNDALKTWCTENIEKEISEINQKIYERVKSVCTVPSHREKFQKESKELVADGGWEEKVKDYPESGTNFIKGIKKDGDTAKNIEAWCKNEIEKEYADDSKNNYPLVLKWCTKNGE